ncbi:MAG: HlyD family secretion protein [Candidatus Sulfopaludibacter sp.]|nr:HlyD family secretion protein [Candidatus Sulfopaludibacter sp.]
MNPAQNLEKSGAPPAAREQPAAPPPAARPRGRGRAFLIFFLVLLVAGTAGLLYWLHTHDFESTDDAQVEMHLDPISSRVEGTIQKVYVENNQFVHAGDPLVDFDPRDFQVALDQVQAALGQAHSQVTAQQPNVPITQVENTANISNSEASVATARAVLASAEHDRDAASARLAEAEANNAKAQADLARYKILIANEEVSRQEYDQVEATSKAQAANVAANRSAVESAGRVVDERRAQVDEARTRLTQYQQNAPQQVAIRQASVRSLQASEQSAQAQLEQARLKLSYARIAAPVDGIVMKRSAEVGAHAAAGQQLLMIAETGNLWITANFKETQLARIQPGQPAAIHVDATGQDFQATVENIGAGTGAVSSVLPPENATGNFVKVVQRIPVRLRFQANQRGLERLRAGMSVEADVRIAR